MRKINHSHTDSCEKQEYNYFIERKLLFSVEQKFTRHYHNQLSFNTPDLNPVTFIERNSRYLFEPKSNTICKGKCPAYTIVATLHVLSNELLKIGNKIYTFTFS